MSVVIKEALENLFHKYDVVFWYDSNNEFTELYDELELDNIKKIEVSGNEFEVKYIINKKAPGEKYLVFFRYARPEDKDNWLLDLELAYKTFYTDQASVIIQELGLDFQFRELVQQHKAFFESKERIVKLKKLLGKDDTYEDIRFKMLAVVFNTEYIDINIFVLAYAKAFIQGNDKIERELDRFNLAEFYWGNIQRKFKYENNQARIYDFLIDIFSTSSIIPKKVTLSSDTIYLLSIWKEMSSYKESFINVSDKIAEDLQIENILENSSLEAIINDDLFKLIDTKIIHELIQRVIDESISDDTLQAYIKERENKFWYADFEAFYHSLSFASQLQHHIKNIQYEFISFQDGVKNYINNYYEVDFLYRKFILWYRKTSQNRVLSQLADKLEKLYVNQWLLPFNNQWQHQVDNLSTWTIDAKDSQRQFYKQYVQPFIDKKQRVFIVISDALRYECAKELNDMLVKENRYDSTIEGMVASLPSYTQLGMASLLPHTELELEEGTDHIKVDGMSSVGVKARASILAKNSQTAATAISAEDFMALNSNKEGREFVKQYDIIYIYHNRIDKIGDDKTTEDKLTEAIEDELIYLKDILKKIANVNGNNMIITSDHGFLYQYHSIDESDFMELNDKQGAEKYNRRFAIGKNFEKNNSIKIFTTAQLGLNGTAEIAIPKSVNRLKVKGAGSKFVHGGATLQELVVPVVKVNKKRYDTTQSVEVDIIKSTDKITTNLVVVSFIQTSICNNTTTPREIRASIVAQDNTIISDVFNYVFDSDAKEQVQREVRHNFHLISLASSKYKNQNVKLRLEEPIKNSNNWKVYKEFDYTLNISFTNDFDF